MTLSLVQSVFLDAWLLCRFLLLRTIVVIWRVACHSAVYLYNNANLRLLFNRFFFTISHNDASIGVHIYTQKFLVYTRHRALYLGFHIQFGFCKPCRYWLRYSMIFPMQLNRLCIHILIFYQIHCNIWSHSMWCMESIFAQITTIAVTRDLGFCLALKFWMIFSFQ